MTKPKSKRCKVCGYRMRGRGHDEGDHHKKVRVAPTQQQKMKGKSR